VGCIWIVLKQPVRYIGVNVLQWLKIGDSNAFIDFVDGCVART